MSTDIVQAGLFDYAALPADTALELRASAERIRLRLKRSAEDIIAIGQELKQAQDRLADHHGGTFLAWIDDEFDMSQRTAYNFMAVADRFGDTASLATVARLGAKALYALAAPSTPDTVVEKVVAGEVDATPAAIREAKEAERKAKEEAAALQAQLAEAERTAERTRRETQAQVKEQIDALQAEIDALRNAPTPEPERIETVREVVPEDVKKRLETLEQLEAQLNAQKDAYKKLEERKDKIAEDLRAQMERNREAEQHEAIRNRWYSVATSLHSSINTALAQLPSPVDAQVFEANDWRRLDDILRAAHRLATALGDMRGHAMSTVVDAEVVG